MATSKYNLKINVEYIRHCFRHHHQSLYFCRCFQIELARNYNHESFFEDLRKLYFNAGAKNEATVFLFTDTQVVEEEFLEDINNILNSGLHATLLGHYICWLFS